MRTYTISDLRRDIRNGPSAWPGMYPLYFIASDGEALSFATVKAELRNVLEAMRDGDNNSGWRVVGCEVNWEDNSLICAHTNDRIKSAYADD